MIQTIRDILALFTFFLGVVVIPLLSMALIALTLVLYVQLGAGLIDVPVDWRPLGMAIIVGLWLILTAFSSYTIRSESHKFSR